LLLDAYCSARPTFPFHLKQNQQPFCQGHRIILSNYNFINNDVTKVGGERGGEGGGGNKEEEEEH
jgi:hypothetical protein